MQTISLADLNLRTGDQRVTVYVYRGHAWLELTGREAIAYAREYGLDLTKLADPTEEACVVTVDEAIEIAKEDPALITVEAPTLTRERRSPRPATARGA